MSYVEATPAEEPRQRSWFRRNWWWVLLLALVAFLVICCGICGGGGLWMAMRLKKTEPYQLALEAVQKNPEVVKRLGEPIEPGYVAVGEVTTENDRGSANIMFDVNGPKGTAHVMSQAQMVDGKWGLTQLEAIFDDGQRITIDTGGGANAPGDAPPWKPSPEPATPPGAAKK